MGFLDSLFRRQNAPPPTAPPMNQTPSPSQHIVGAKGDDVNLTFNDRNITFTGDLATFDYDAILRDKQRNIYQLFQLSDYFVDADPIYRGIIKEVYAPFCMADKYRLVGANEKVKAKYLDYYERIHLEDFMRSVFYQYWKYGNVYIYLKDDGTLETLPVHLVRISNVMVNGEPVIEFNCQSILTDFQRQAGSIERNYIEDQELDIRLKGFPREVSEGAKKGVQWVQLNPANTFVLQDVKEDWIRYAVPMVAACLKAFAKKALISNWENALLNLGARSFVHATYGDPNNKVLPTLDALEAVQNIMRQAMTGSALAVTNNWCKATVIQPKTDDVFEYDKYKAVNADILSAGGISGVIVSGRSEDGSTFASAQVSMQTAAIRIKQAKDNFCEMMDKINARLNGSNVYLPHSADVNVPRFTFPPVDLTGNKAFLDACLRLWEKGMLSNETLLQTYGYDMKQEVERRKNEDAQNVPDTLTPPKTTYTDTSSSNNNNNDGGNAIEVETRGRPTLDDSERNSDPAKSITGRQPKGSNPEGSEPQETTT